ALCAMALKSRDTGTHEPRFIETLRRVYHRALGWVMQRRAVVVGGALALLCAGWLSGSSLGREFLPELDEGDFVVFVEMPSSISLEAAQEILLDTRRRILEFPEVRATMSEQGRPEDGTNNENVNMS